MKRRSTAVSRRPGSARSPWSRCCSRRPLPASPTPRSSQPSPARGRSPVAPEPVPEPVAEPIASEPIARRETIDDIDALLHALPPEIVAAIHALPDREGVIEVVLDLGRRPEARFPDAEVTLLDREITE